MFHVGVISGRAQWEVPSGFHISELWQWTVNIWRVVRSCLERGAWNGYLGLRLGDLGSFTLFITAGYSALIIMCFQALSSLLEQHNGSYNNSDVRWRRLCSQVWL